jgi:ankyrin repeat protein
MVANWTVQSGQSEDEGIRSEAYMELSASHLLGFGVEQDLTKSLNLLREARRGSKIARRIFQQVSKAFSSDGLSTGDVNGVESYFQGRLIRMPSPILITLDRFATPQVQSHVHRKSTTSTSANFLSLIEQELSKDKASPKILDMDVLEDLWQKHAQHSLAQKDISEALGDACKTGSFEIASILARLCVKYIGPHGGPTPLHWLVMFPMEQAASMAKLLIQAHGDDQDTSISARFCRLMRTHSPDIIRPYVGICHNLVNSQTTCSVYLPEHCMELVGAPLHWAVRCNNLELVRLLLEYGANPDLRCKVSSRLPGEPRSIIPLNYNALDIALEYHLFGIAELLLEYAKKRGARIEIGASLLARTTTTWSRYVIHGSSYRLAFRRTIEVLIDYGWNLTRPDYFDEIPLLVALGNNAEERYIIEDLIQHFDPSTRPARMGDAELATHIVTHSDSEFASSPWKMERMMPFIKDLNKMDERGRNALHYCSLLGNAVLADVLIGTGRVDINAVSSSTDRSTPLRSAAEFGKVDVVQLLLERGADIDFPNTNEEKPPLERAIMNRQYETASLLIKHGASLDFGLSEGFAPRNSVLHAACINGSARPPMVKRLLKDHPRLRAKAVIDRAQRLPSTNMTHMSPLWLAVYYADLESAEAFLEHGADPDLFNTNFDINIPTELCDNVDIFQRSVKLQSHENMVTARGLVDHILKRAVNHPLDKGQLQVALEWRSELMRGVAFRTEQAKGRNKALSSQTGILAAFDSRLDEIQTEKQEPAVRAFIARLEEIKRLMEQHAPRVRQTDLVNMKLQRT